MSPNEKIAQLEELERRDQGRQRMVARVSWLSVAAAAVVLAVMVGASYRALTSIRTEIASLTAQKTKLTTEIQQLDEENKLKAQTIRALDPVIDPKRELLHNAEVPMLPTMLPPLSAIPPRIYLQTVASDDLDFARRMSQALTNAKYAVAGIENVPHAVKPSQTDVRYYKKHDKDVATAIAKILEHAGAGPVMTTYLSQYENSPGARPNHFEVWFPAEIGKVKRVN